METSSLNPLEINSQTVAYNIVGALTIVVTCLFVLSSEAVTKGATPGPLYLQIASCLQSQAVHMLC